MTINTERLKTDVAYWDVVCDKPHSTHYCTMDDEFLNDKVHSIDTCCIPRPTKPASPEWGGRHMPLPGQILEVKDVDGNWKRAKLRAISDRDWWIFVIDEGLNAVCSPAPEHRAIRTKEQREREELIELAFSTVQKIPSTESAIAAVVDAIIAAGWTKP